MCGTGIGDVGELHQQRGDFIIAYADRVQGRGRWRYGFGRGRVGVHRLQRNAAGNTPARSRDVKTRDYVYLSGWDGTPFTAVRDRLANDPTWRVHTLDSGHDVWRDAPQEFLGILLLGE